MAVETAVCFLLPQKTRPPLIRPIDVVILFLSSRLLVQSVSEYTTRLLVGLNLIRDVTELRRYRNNCRRACTCRLHRSYICQLRRPRVYAISSLVYTIKYIIEPIRSRYSVGSILISSGLDKLRLVSLFIGIQTGFKVAFRNPNFVSNPSTYYSQSRSSVFSFRLRVTRTPSIFLTSLSSFVLKRADNYE